MDIYRNNTELPIDIQTVDRTNLEIKQKNTDFVIAVGKFETNNH